MAGETFELKFSQLVDSALRTKIPALLEYRVGFQTIEKSEEEKDAVGISVFIVRGLWIYMPIFFIKGDLKGYDLMYIKQNDVFVPARDNWIASFKEKGGSILGEAKDQHSIGDIDDSFKEPEDVQISENDMFWDRTASESNLGVTQELIDKMKKRASEQFKIDLTDSLIPLGSHAHALFANTMMKNAEFANNVFKFYTVDEMKDLGNIFSMHMDKGAMELDDVGGQIEIITDISSESAKSLKESEKKALIRQGVFVKDERNNFSKIFKTRIDPGVVSNPVESGIYDILLSDGTWTGALVFKVTDLDGSASPLHCEKRSSWAVILPDDKNKYFVREGAKLFAKAASNETIEKFVKEKGGIKANASSIASALSSDNKSSADRITTSYCPVIFTQGIGRCFSVELALENGRPNIVNNVINSQRYPDSKNITIEFTDKDGKLSVHGERLFVPSSSRIFIKHSYKDDKNLMLGSPQMIVDSMMKEADLDYLKIVSSGDFNEIIVENESTGLIDKIASVKYLSEKVGIFAGQAQQMLKEASTAQHRMSEYLVKVAAPYKDDLGTPKPYSSGINPSEKDSIKETTVTGKGEALKDTLPEDVLDQANQAAKSGIKEVFDASVLKSLIDVADLSEMRKDYISDMILGMDRVGRMLFLYYWHNEEFEDRYGKEDMDKLEETLKNVFVTTGDLVLFLKEKIAYAPDSAESVIGSLSEDIGETADAEQGGL